ncbi:MAG: UDP-N-acetylmuramate dehydrogenase [Desulfofustis sp.]|jgi:UDP-N-acetylmuramate dehydrogenase|nr:UDP-N-acetylmuramate dehydrogenase [Desulfofustis sp.]
MTLSSSQKAALTRAVGDRSVRWDVPLASRTTYRIGGPADALVTLLAVEELQRVLALCRSEGLRWKVFGRGSNILADDDGFRGVIIVLEGKFKYIVRQGPVTERQTIIHAGAAVGLPRLADWCSAEGLSGLEFAAGIPGSVAGAVIMNAGAWGEDMAGVVAAVELTGAEDTLVLDGQQLRFSYRCCESRSDWQADRVISAVLVRLKPEKQKVIKERMGQLLDKRRSSQPSGLPSGGCVFKNPPGMSAGRLIDEAGLKGTRIGDARVDETHGNFFVNCGAARAADIQALMKLVCERVYRHSGVRLEPELEFLPAEAGI